MRSGPARAVSCVPTPPTIHSPAIASPRAVGSDASIVRTTPFSRITIPAAYASVTLPSWSETRPLPRQSGAGAALVAVALIAWIVTYRRMHGMDAGPGTDLGGLFWFVGIWVTMMAAMMLPSAAPMVLVFSRLNYQRAVRDRTASVPTWIFVAGYLIAWTAYGLIAYAVYRV